MLLDQVTDEQIKAGQIAAGAAMVAFLAAPYFRRYAQPIRLTVAALYVAGVLGFLLYYLL
jgi:hypothetical protein